MSILRDDSSGVFTSNFSSDDLVLQHFKLIRPRADLQYWGPGEGKDALAQLGSKLGYKKSGGVDINEDNDDIDWINKIISIIERHKAMVPESPEVKFERGYKNYVSFIGIRSYFNIINQTVNIFININ